MSQSILQRNLGILYQKYIGENIARGGTPLWRKNRFLFIQKVVRNRLVWGMGNVTIFIFQINKKKNLSHTRIVQDNRIFMFWSLFSLFFDEEPLENILCIQRRPAHAKPDFNSFSCPRNGTWKRTCGISCLRSLAPMWRFAVQHNQATSTNPSLLRATPLLRAMLWFKCPM